MQIKLFTIPIDSPEAVQNELNAFLRGNKILEVESHLHSNAKTAQWCFCIKYLGQPFTYPHEKKEKVDYKTVLDEGTFQKFVHLRERRKKLASQEGLSAFIIFTDAELAELAKLDMITEKTMLTIKGIGEKKVRKYGSYFFTQPNINHEKSRLSP